MTKKILILLSFILSNAILLAQTSKESRLIKPSNFQKKISTIVSGKTRSYYALSTVEASVINVQGPGKLKVITRGQFRHGETGRIKYDVLYAIDGEEILSESVSGAVRSSKAIYSDETLGIPGEYKAFEIELLRGYHTIEFKLKENTYNAAARYIFTPAKIKKQEWKSFSPMLPSQPVELISRESTTVYYRFSLEEPLYVEIIGPSELRVFTRTENHYQMKGRINYRVQVRENGNTINTYQLNSRVSEVAVYSDDKNLVPGKAREIVIYAPKGKHIYEIVPLDKDKSTLLGRIMIPLKDISLEVN